MANILIGVLQPGARTFGVGITKPRRGVAMFNGIPRGVIVKSCTPSELAAECFCALLLDSLGINAPQCGIVYEDEVPFFGSVDLVSPNLMQHFCINPDIPNVDELKAAVQELVQWVGFGRLIALDILISNADRHPGNLITDGVDFWAIDHGRTLGLFPYSGHKSYQLVKQLSDPFICANLEASAVSNALTFPANCHILAESEISRHAITADYAKPFAQLVISRQPSLASSIQGLL
jgi:hypothetical protein